MLAGRRLDNGDLLSVPELAALAHLPTDEAIPGVARAGAKALAPPPGIATPGPGAKPLGVTDSGHPRPVALRVSDARHHLHVLGATGSGKSTLLAQMILADADAGRGIVLIDPKGDLVTDVLSRLPRSAADRLVLIDADSRARPPCLNPLDGGDTDLIVDNLVSVFRRVYSAFWGPRTDDVMRAACLTLRAQHGVATLAELPKLLADARFPLPRDRRRHRPRPARFLVLVRRAHRLSSRAGDLAADEQTARVPAAPLRPRRPGRRPLPPWTSRRCSTAGSAWCASRKARSGRRPPA